MSTAIAEYEKLVAYCTQKGGKCLSGAPDKSVFPIAKIQCEKKHVWLASPAKILKGGWCPKCVDRRKKHSIEELQAIAKERGGKCLTEKYLNVAVSILWECKAKHQWHAPAHSILRGTWCGRCRTDETKNTIEDMQVLASKFGGECLSKKYTNNVTHLRWKCAEGHKWMAQPSNVTVGRWCPECANVECRLTLNDLHATAKAKGGKCLAKKYLSNRQKIGWECKYGHRWFATTANVRNRSWCPYCVRNRRHSIEKMQEVAKQFGGLCLSTVYKNSRFKLKWKCLKGHVFYKAPNHVMTRGQWCKLCRKSKPLKG